MVSSILNHQKGKFDMVHVQNSTLSGGVAAGAICNMMVSPGGAVAVGIASGALSVLGYRFVTVSEFMTSFHKFHTIKIFFGNTKTTQVCTDNII